jgi:hypothetical protein
MEAKSATGEVVKKLTPGLTANIRQTGYTTKLARVMFSFKVFLSDPCKIETSFNKAIYSS